MGQEAIIDMENAVRELEEEELVRIYAEMGMEYDPETKEIKRIVKEKDYITEEKEKSSIKEEEIVETSSSGLTNTDVEHIDKAIEAILVKIANAEPIDINNEARLNQVINTLDEKLEKITFLGKPEDLDDSYNLVQIFTSPMRDNSDIIYLYTYTEKEGE